MKVIHYKAFKTDREFTEWQLKYKLGVHSVAPFIQTIDMDIATEKSVDQISEDATAKAQTNVGVFVTYIEEVFLDEED